MKKFLQFFVVGLVVTLLSGCVPRLDEAYREGRYDEVIARAEETIKSHNEVDHLLVANSLLKKGRVDDARKWLERCVELRSIVYFDSHKCAGALARLDFESGGIDTAVRNYRRARDEVRWYIGENHISRRSGEQFLASIEADLAAALAEQRRRQQTAVPTAPARLPPENDPARLDLAFWDSVKTSTNPSDFLAYLQKFPTGTFAGLARARLTSLGEAPVRFTPLALPAPGAINFGRYHA
ncbi:MAG: tetratricopeptide repeat protein, partial [Gammaproteobacteria bacterium]